jgi:heterodisulfide reductase subunit D
LCSIEGKMGNRDYSVRQLMELEACTNCQACADICPAVSAAEDGELSALFRMKGLKEILKGRTGLFRRIFKKQGLSDEAWKHFSDTAFRCTLCGNCQGACPVGIRLKDLWLSLRQDLVHSGFYPKKINMIKENLEESRNVFDEDNEERADWVEDMRDPPADGYVREKAEVVYFTGCTAAYFPIAQKIPMALAQVMDVSGVDFTLLGEDEWCCGFPMLGAGLMELFREFRDHNIQAVKERGAKEILFACPSCYQMWKEYYRPEGLRLSHASQFLVNLVKAGKVPLKELDMTVTYHDPCDLGRGALIYEEPRELIQSLPGVKLVELPRNRRDCQCCGGGGNLEMVDAKLTAEIAKAKIDEILSTGAQTVVTSCQQCVRTMTTYVKRNKISLEVLDITQLVHRALEH